MTPDPNSLAAAAARTQASMAARASEEADSADDEDDDEEGEEADWGLNERKPRMATQTIIGLTVIVVLLGMFGVLIYKKVQERNALAAKMLKDKDGNATTADSTDPNKKENGKGDIVLAGGKGDAKPSGDIFDDPAESGPKKHATPKKDVAKVSPKSNDLEDLGGLEGLDADTKKPADKPARGTAPADDFEEALPSQPPGRGLAGKGDGKPDTKKPTMGSAKTSTGDDLLTDQDEPEVGSVAGKSGSKAGHGHPSSTKPQTFASDRKPTGFPQPGGHTLPPLGNKPVASKGLPSTIDEELEEEPAPGKKPNAGVAGLPTASLPNPRSTTSLPSQSPPARSTPQDDFGELPVTKAEPKLDSPSAPARSAVPKADPRSSDKLGDFTIADDAPPKKIPVEPAAPLKPVPTAPKSDPRLDGFEVVEEDTTRATSKTIVQRPPQMLQSSSGISLTDVSGSKSGGTVPTPIDEEEPLSVAPRRQPAASPVTRTVPAPRTAAPEASYNPQEDSYRIAPNDNFWTISRKQYGTGRYFQALLEHNRERVGDPNRMRPGTVISTPPREVLEQKYPSLIEKAAAAAPAAPVSSPRPDFTTGSRNSPLSSGRTLGRAETGEPADLSAGGFFVGPGNQPMYRIGQADMLTSIAQRHLGRTSRWTEIFELNKDAISNPDALKIGTVIRLPPDASRVGFVSEGSPRR